MEYLSPMYSFKSITPEDLMFREYETLQEVRRYDYINLVHMDKDIKREVLKEFMSEYEEAFSHGRDYKDSICYRSYFKDFVIREAVDKENKDDHTDVRFYAFKIRGRVIVSGDQFCKDNRVMEITLYTLHNDAYMRDAKFLFKLSHKDQLFIDIDNLLDKKHEDRNYHILPLYLNTYRVAEGKYERASIVANYHNPDHFDHYLNMVIQSIARFNAINYHLLSLVEDNKPVEVYSDGDYRPFENLVQYIKEEATEDKRVKVKLAENCIASIKPDNRNIYDHSNIIIRKLCDYRYQVRGHYQGYWYGTKGNQVKKYVWKEAYFKNKDKPFRIIKERDAVEV